MQLWDKQHQQLVKIANNVDVKSDNNSDNIGNDDNKDNNGVAEVDVAARGGAAA